MYNHCGVLGVGRSPKTDCSTSSQAKLFKCDGILGTQFGSNVVECADEIAPPDSATNDPDPFDAFLNHVKANKDTFMLNSRQDEICAGIGEKMPSACGSIPFCAVMTDEERAQRGSSSTQTCGNPILTKAAGLQRKLAGALTQEQNEQLQSVLPPSMDHTNPHQTMEEYLEESEGIKLLLDVCKHIPAEVGGRSVAPNSHGACQLDGCVELRGVRELCGDPAKTADDFSKHFENEESFFVNA